MSVPQDIRLTEAQGTSINDTGDFETVTDNEYIQQSIAIDVIRTFDHGRGEPLTSERIEDYRTEVIHILEDNEYVEPPVEVEPIGVDGDALFLYISTADHELQLEI